MFSWIAQNAKRFSVNLQLRESEDWVRSLRNSDPDELGLLLAMTTHMRHRLEAEYQVGLLYPHIVALEKSELPIKIISLIKYLQRQNNPAAASGLFPWLFTLRACLNLELRPVAREMWLLLSRGERFVSQAASDIQFMSGFCPDIREFYLYPEGFQPNI